MENDAQVARLPAWLVYKLGAPSDSWYHKSLEDLAAEVESAPEGTRNDTLNLAMFVACMNDRMDDGEAAERLRDAALTAGLNERETDATLRSARKGAQRKMSEHAGTLPNLVERGVQRTTGTDLVKRATDTWEPANLEAWFSADRIEVVPTIGKRDDGVYLLYPGRTHSVVAETESGKSWLALLWCAQEMKQGNNVTYLDFEDNIDGILTRLTDIADEDKILKHFTYVRPWGAMPENVASWYPDKSLIVVDGVGEALSLHGLKDDADGFLWLDGHLMRPLAATGAAVVSLDHVPKSKENQDSAIGTVHKTNSITGASYLMKNVEPFGLGQSGYSRLFVRKDRPGWIRKECIDGGNRELAAELHVISDDPNLTSTLKLRTPAPIESANEYSIKEQISNYTSDLSKPASKNEIARHVRGDRNKVLAAIDEMLSDGYLENLGTVSRPKIKRARQWRPPF